MKMIFIIILLSQRIVIFLKLGSLSVREDILENDVQTNIKELNDEEPCETEVIKQLKKIKESKKNIENEY